MTAREGRKEGREGGGANRDRSDVKGRGSSTPPAEERGQKGSGRSASNPVNPERNRREKEKKGG